MSRISVLLILLLLNADIFAQTNKDIPDDKKGGMSIEFAKHSFEFAMGPSADYLIYQQGLARRFKDPEPYKTYLPFVGFNFGGQYLFHPIKWFRISTGFHVILQGLFVRVRDGGPYAGSDQYDQANGSVYVSVPVYLHLYRQMKHGVFDFNTGPDFNFLVYERDIEVDYHYGYYREVFRTTPTAKEIRDNAGMGWSLFLGQQRPICAHADFLVGGEIKVINVVYFNRDMEKYRNEEGGFYNTSLGLILGLRFH